MKHRLYSFRRCPYAIRARLALAVSGLDPDLREVDLKNRPEALRAASPKATVPVLVCDDGTVLDESLDIMRWALGTADPEGWLPRDREVTDTEALLAHNDGPFKRALDRFKYATRYPDADPVAARTEAEGFVKTLEQRLRAQPNLCGPEIRLADAAIFPFVRQFAGADAAWFQSTPYAAVRRWLETWTEHSLFRAIMGKLPPWQPGDAAVSFRTAYGLPPGPTPR